LTPRRVTALVAGLVLTGALAACGDSSSSEPEDAGSDSASPSASQSPSESASESPSESASPSLDPAVLANSYVSTQVTGYDLVANTSIRLTFEDGNLSANAGCNTMFAPYELTEDTLAWTGEPAQTMMGCVEDLAAQDEWLAGLLTGGVEAASTASGLTLTSGDVVIELARAPEEDLQQLLGKTWTVVATMADGKTDRIPQSITRPRIVAGADGLSRLNTSCNTGRTTVTVDETSITFGHPAITRRGCQEPERTIEQRVLAVVDGTSDYVVFDGSVLIVVKGDHGLVFQVR